MKLTTTIPRNQVVTVSDPESGAVLLVFETVNRCELRFEGVIVGYVPRERSGKMTLSKCPGDALTSRGVTSGG